MVMKEKEDPPPMAPALIIKPARLGSSFSAARMTSASASFLIEAVSIFFDSKNSVSA